MEIITLKLTNCLENALFRQLIQQLNKDFQQTNIDLGLLETDTPSQVANHLIKVIEELLLSNEVDFRNILYRVDVDEKKIKALSRFEAVDIAQLIVERVIQKVTLRQQFSA